MKFKNNISIIKFATLLIFLTIALSTQSCAVSGMGSPITFIPQKTSNGLIFGSITFPKEKARYNGYFLSITYISNNKGISNKNSSEVHFSPEQIIKMKHAGVADDGLTYLFALETPPGPYAITSIRLFSNNGFGIIKNDVVGNFSIPFNLNKGEILYVGNIMFNEYASKNETIISYKNNFARDVESIKKGQRYIYWDGAKNDESINISYNKI